MGKRQTPSILLVFPSCFYYPVTIDRVEIKTSMLWLASYLDQFYPVTYADIEFDIGRPGTPIQVRRYERQARRFLSEQSFDILAISCWTSLSYQATMMLARLCRELYPDKVIVVGGYHVSARPQEFITADRPIDYIVTREGEIALKEIADSFTAAGRPAEPQIISGPAVTLDHFIDYNWDLIDEFYARTFPDGIDNMFVYLSRGCPFGCSFCMEPSKVRLWRAFEPAKAVDVLCRSADRFKSRAVAICDACFGMRPSWRKEFIRALVEREPKFWVVFETRPEYIDAEDIKLLADLRLEIQFGIESGSPDMLRLMKKTRQPERYLNRFAEVSQMLSEHKILHRANMIFNHPGETQKTLEETFAFVDRMLEPDNSYLMWANAGYMHFPGCEIDTNRLYYEQEFGARFLCGDWWKEDTDQFENSQRVIPSRDLDGDNVDLWQRMMADRDARMRDSLAPQAFTFAALKYFYKWQNDTRFTYR